MTTPLRLIIGLTCVLLAASCSTLPTDYPKEVSTAFDSPETTEIGGIIEQAAARHPGQSGFAVIPDNHSAFVDRVALAEFAERTLDVQYYIWADDTIGRTLGERIIRAAERGVRVRFLIDDINFRNRDSIAAALSSHPNIDVRMFNPSVHRSIRMLEAGFNFKRLNKRMHNKVMIMDNACAIVGGRNIGDEYFGLNPEFNMRDLDIVAAGPVVRTISNTFDEFWNSKAAVPIEVLVDDQPDSDEFKERLTIAREQLNQQDFPFPLDADLKTLRANIRSMTYKLIWARGDVLHDSIESMKGTENATTLVDQLRQSIANAENEVTIESAYFVLLKPSMEATRKLCERGVRVRILTNSLASNDVVAAQAGYQKRTKDLLRAGAELYELRPDAEAVLSNVTSEAKSAITGLHTKALVIDDQSAFVGSFNLDPRSAEINSEIGILVHHPQFAADVRAYLDEGVAPENAYRLTLDERGRKQWKTTIDGELKTWTKDPETSFFRRLTARIVGWLPIDDQL